MIKINKKNLSKRIIISILFLLCSYILFQSFYSNKWQTVDNGWFNQYQSDSESLITGRLLLNKIEGTDSKGGFLGYYEFNSKQKEMYLSGEAEGSYTIYPRQIGLQGRLFSFIDKVTNFSPEVTLNLLYSINSILLALCFMFIIAWIYKQFGIASAATVFTMLVFSPWITVSARNLYWVIWTMFLPLAAALALLWFEEKSNKYSNILAFTLAFITIAIKAACGYEFISVLLISLELPLIYYAIKNKYTIKKYIKRATIIGLGGISGFIAAITVHFVMLSQYTGSKKEALKAIVNMIGARTNFIEVGGLDHITKLSLESKLLDVLQPYWLYGEPIAFNFRMREVMLLTLIAIALIFISKEFSNTLAKDRRKLIAMAVATIVSFLAPLSWHILAKGHSYVHTHINYVLWSIPTTIFCFALIGANLSYLLKDVYYKFKDRHSKIGYCVVIAFILVFGLFINYRININNNTTVNYVINNGITMLEEEEQEIYLSGSDLYFIAPKALDTKDKYKLQLILINSAGEKVQKYYDFYFIDNKLQLPFWSNKKVAKVTLPPELMLNKMTVGQYKHKQLLWEKEIMLKDIIQFDEDFKLIPYDASNESWTKGIEKKGNRIMLQGAEMKNTALIDRKIKDQFNNIYTVKNVIITSDGWTFITVEESLANIKDDVTYQFTLVD